MASGKSIATATAPDWQGPPVVFSPDGRLIASASHNQAIQLWEMPAGHLGR